MMIRHAVLWKLRDAAGAPRFKSLLETCRVHVAGRLQFERGIRQPAPDADVDVALVSLFSDQAALDACRHHPVHQAVSAQLGPLRKAR